MFRWTTAARTAARRMFHARQSRIACHPPAGSPRLFAMALLSVGLRVHPGGQSLASNRFKARSGIERACYRALGREGGMR